jgi:hypothetical protein
LSSDQQQLQDGRLSHRTQGGEGEQDCDRGQRRVCFSMHETREDPRGRSPTELWWWGGHVRCLSRCSTRRPSRPDGFLGGAPLFPFGTS